MKAGEFMAIFESIFNVTYLVSVTIISAFILTKGIKQKRKSIILFGVMGLLLGFGDSFHLVPRIIGHLTTGLDDYNYYLGMGKLITGITMTIFYYLIYLYYVLETGKKNQKTHLTIILFMLIRFVLLALPGNEWALNTSSLLYGVIRNIPFSIIGIIIVYLFLNEQHKKQFKPMGWWIIVSFICYLIVVIGAGFVPVLGAFMLPKTVAYFIIIYLGYKYI